MRIYLIILFIAIACLSLFAETKAPLFPVPQIPIDPEQYNCYHPQGPMEIDGQLDDIEWKDVPWTTPFADIVSKDMPKPRFQTKVKMLWDEEYLYIAAELEEPDLWATLTQRDAVIFHDNDFEVFIDPDGDTHNYYELEINALNTVWDLFLLKPYRDGDKVALDSWDIQGLKTAVHLNGTLNDPSDKDVGWTVEIAIPWKPIGQLEDHYPPRTGDVWRMNFSRVEWRHDVLNEQYIKSKDKKGNTLPEDNWVWSPQGLVAMHYPEMWGYVRFLDEHVDEHISDKVSSIDPGTYHNEEHISEYLRKLYYAEKEYYLRYHLYSTEVEIGNLVVTPNLKIKPVKIDITPCSFIAHIDFVNGSSSFCINNEGKTWVETKK
jgi:hypothetical protein